MRIRRAVLILMTSVLLTACGSGNVPEKESGVETETVQKTEELQETKVVPESTDSVQRRYEDGLPVYDSWESDLTELYELKDNTPDLSLDAIGFQGYKFDLEEAAAKSVAELALELKNGMEGMRITYIGQEDNHFLFDEDYNLIMQQNVEDAELNCVEEIQAALLDMINYEEEKEDYDGFFRGLIFLMNGDTMEEADCSIEIHLGIREGAITEKQMEFTGNADKPISYYFSSFILNEMETPIFDVDCEDEPEIIKDHSKDNLYTLDYIVDVLKPYGLDVTINEMQWDGEVGNSNLRVNFTFVNNTPYKVLAQPRNGLVLNDKGEKVSTFLTWSEEIPAGESDTFDIEVRNLGNVLSSIEMGFYFTMEFKTDIETDILKISDFINETPTITFSGEIVNGNAEIIR